MSNSSSPLLEVKNLKKYFKTPKGMLHAVDDVSFTIDRGRTLGVVGRIWMRKIHHWPCDLKDRGTH